MATQQHIFKVAGPPATTPPQSGHHYIDTASKIPYISVGSSSSGDWFKVAGVQDSITNGVLDFAPSQNAVFDALSQKLDLTGGSISGNLSISGTVTGASFSSNGVSGAGFFAAVPQISDPSTPGSGFRMFADSLGRVAIKNTSGFKTTFDNLSITADRVFTLPNVSGTILMDPTTTNGDILARIAGVLTRIGIGGEDYILRVVGGTPSWQEENLMQDIGGGTDGTVILNNSFTAPDNLYYLLLKVDTGALLNPDAYIVYARTLDLTTAPVGSITRNGTAGVNATANTGAAGGGAFTARVLATNGAGGTGAAGAINAGVQGAAGGVVAVGNGGNGGASGTSGAGGSGAAANGIAGGAVTTNMKFDRFEYNFLRGITQVGGGAGGRGGNSGGGDGGNSSRGGGGGGAGGGVLVLICGEIITDVGTPSGVIQARGGAGGRQINAPASGNVGGASGAGGGGGGYIYCAYVKKTGPVVTNLFDASGGAGGNGSPGLGTGIGGSGGAGGNGGRIQLFNITEGAGTLVTGLAGQAGTAGSGVTPGVGGAGGVCVASL